jgi:hypothetical protein
MSDDLTPDDFLSEVETDGASAMPAPDGFKQVPLHEAAIFVPRTAKPNQELRLARGTIEWHNGVPRFNPNGMTPKDYLAWRRWYAQARMMVPDDSAAGIAAWESQAAALVDYQAECEEAFFRDHPDMAHIRRASIPAERAMPATDILYTPLKRGR